MESGFLWRSKVFAHLTVSFEDRDYSRQEMVYKLTNFVLWKSREIPAIFITLLKLMSSADTIYHFIIIFFWYLLMKNNVSNRTQILLFTKKLQKIKKIFSFIIQKANYAWAFLLTFFHYNDAITSPINKHQWKIATQVDWSLNENLYNYWNKNFG